MVTIIHVTYENLSWAHEISGKSWDELLDALLEAEKYDMPCTVECPSS